MLQLRTAELHAQAGFLAAVAVHGQACRTARATVFVQLDVMPVGERGALVEVDESLYALVQEKMVERHGVVGRVQCQLFGVHLREKSAEQGECLDKSERIMARGRQQQREHGQIAVRLSGSQQVKVIAVVVAIPRRIPAPERIRLRIVAVALAVRDAALTAVAYAVLAASRGRFDRRAIASQKEILSVDEPLVDGVLQKQLEDAQEPDVGLANRQGGIPPLRYFASDLALLRRVRFLVFAVRSLGHIFLGAHMRPDVGAVQGPEARGKIVERADSRDVAAVAPAADPRVKHVAAEPFHPIRDGRHLEKSSQEAGDEHAGRRIRSGTKLRVGFREKLIHGSQVDGHDGADEFLELFADMAVRKELPQGSRIGRLAKRIGIHGNTSFGSVKKTFHFSEGAKRPDFCGFVKGLAAKKIKIAIPCAPSAESVGGTDKNKASKPLKNLGLETLKKY